MTAPALEELKESGQVTVSVEEAARWLSVGRTLAYRLAREQGELCEGVRVIRVGRLLRVPVPSLIRVLEGDE